MMKSFRNKNGFTLIELLVVIGILGILVLLAAPKFLGYTKDAKLVQVQNDIRAVENSIAAERIVNDDYIDGWETVDKADLEEYKDSRLLYDKKGSVKNSEELNDEYFKVNSNLVKSKLKGDFILAKGGNVYYHDKDGVKSENDSEEEIEEIKPTDEDLGMENDFTWVSNSNGYVGLNGEKGHFRYTGTGEEVVEIPHVIQGVEMTSYYRLFNYSGGNVTKVISTNKNITSTKEMFYFSVAPSLDLSEFNTSNVTDMSGMFLLSTANSLNISSFNTSKVTDMSRMFQQAKAKELNLKSFNTSKVTDMSRMFMSTDLTSFDLSSFDTSNVTNMTEMFSYLKASSLDLSMFDTSNVTSLEGMFSHSTETSKEVDLSSFDTSNVTNMKYLFYKSHMTKFDLNSFDTSNVTDMTGMFSDSKLTELDLSMFDTSNVTSMNTMFTNSSMTELNLRSFDTSKVTDMAGMFNGSQAEEFDLSSFDMSNVTNTSVFVANTNAKVGYARTAADAQKINSSNGKPAGLTFVVR